MNYKDITQKTNAINDDVVHHRLKKSFDKLRLLVDEIQHWEFSNTLQELETNYRYMLHYLIEGIDDPEQRQIYNQLAKKTLALSDDIVQKASLQDSPTLFFEKKRLHAIRPPLALSEFRKALQKHTDTCSFIDLLEEGDEKEGRLYRAHKSHQQIVSELFYALFTESRWKKEHHTAYHAFFSDALVPSNDKCVAISAITLNLLQQFDTLKIDLLLDVCKSDNVPLAIRAIVGLIPVFQHYAARWKFYPELTNRLKLLSDDALFSRRLITAILQFIESRDTEKITRKLTEEIFPEMMKLSPIIGKKIKLDEWIGETGMDEKNPEWQKILDEAGLSDKLQEFSNLQLEGADVFHSTFSNLKSYPFFNEIHSWFLPFDALYTEIHPLFASTSDRSVLMESITNSSYICNSDKYSFCFSVMTMPTAYRKMMLSQLGSENEEMKRMLEEEFAINPHQNDETSSKQYIQDLYRFFKLFRRKNDFVDIFSLPLNFHTIEAFGAVMESPANLSRIALYYFEKNHFEEALSSYQMLADYQQENGEVWQKIGYCKQMLGDISGALQAYLHADLIESNNTWLLQRIAYSYRLLKEPKKALEYYHRLAHLHPDDLRTQLSIGHCFLALKQYNEALNNYFKVELEENENQRAWRSIAWCAFLSRKFDIAQRYYAKILQESPNTHDFLNAGHVELCLNNPKKSIDFYHQAQQKTADFSTFEMLINEDLDELQEAGVNTHIIPFVIDKMRYDDIKSE